MLPRNNAEVMLRIDYSPVSVPRVNHTLTHTFMGVLYISFVGISLLVLQQGRGKPRTGNE